jgi:hypothetical protein
MTAFSNIQYNPLGIVILSITLKCNEPNPTIELIILCVLMLSVVTHSDILLSDIMLSVVILSVMKLNVIALLQNVVLLRIN